MPEPTEAARLLGETNYANDHSTTPYDPNIPGASSHDPTVPPGHTGASGYEWKPKPTRYHKPVDMNIMKRNMSIAKGFMDISLLTANASQLKHLLIYGNKEETVYYVILTGLVLSLILQIVTGILLVVKERFDINVESDHASADHYNNVTVVLVFITLLLNVFVSSFGVSIKEHPEQQYPHKNGYGGLNNQGLGLTGKDAGGLQPSSNGIQ